MRKFIFLCALIGATASWADSEVQSEVVDGVTWYYRTGQQWNSQTQKNETYAYITSGSDKYAGDLTVPSQLGEIPVKSIGNEAFRDCNGLTRITIPSSVTSVGWYAFYGCITLTDVTIPSSVVSIGERSFSECSGLKSVLIPNSVVSIGAAAFRGCSGLTNVSMPQNVTCIGFEMFCGCEGLTCVTIPTNVTSIGTGAFSHCSGLTHVSIPSRVTSIGEEAFYCCSGLISVTIPSSVASIGVRAFSHCGKLLSVTIPSSVTCIGSEAFGSCDGLTSMVFGGSPPSGVQNIGLASYQIVIYPRTHGAAWMKILSGIDKFGGYNYKYLSVSVLSSKIRENDPTILDVVYKVTSSVTNTVKVRTLAFEDGVRSFANVVRPETFVADTNGVETAGNVGDTVAANVEHTLSWKVSSDWSNQLAKVTFEVLATEGDLLPFEVRTIPASDRYGTMDVTWNAITENQWFDALLWLYADKNPKVTLSNGVYYYNGKVAAKDTAIYYNKAASNYYSRTYDSDAGQYVYVRYKNAPEIVLEEMGYTLLSGDVLNYVNEETRLGLSPSGARQYGYKIVSEK